MATLYCFDFDGTLTHRDTMFAFLKFADKQRFQRYFLGLIPQFAFVKFGLTDPARVKLKFIASVLKNLSENEIHRLAQDFFQQKHNELLRPNALKFIQNLDLEKNKALMVTASLDFWARPFAEFLGLELVATRAKLNEGKFQGEIIGQNCNGAEKVHRIEEIYSPDLFEHTVAFGDTKGDLPMLSWAKEKHYRPFH